MVMMVKRGFRDGQRTVSRTRSPDSLTMRGFCVGIVAESKCWIAMMLACNSTLRPIKHHGKY